MSIMSAKKMLLAGGLSLEPETEALLARMTVEPSRNRKKLINDAIAAMKVEGIWERLKVLCFVTAHTQQAAQLNWLDANFNLSLIVGGTSPIFEVDLGMVFPSTQSYFRIGAGSTPATLGINSINDVSIVSAVNPVSVNLPWIGGMQTTNERALNIVNQNVRMPTGANDTGLSTTASGDLITIGSRSSSGRIVYGRDDGVDFNNAAALGTGTAFLPSRQMLMAGYHNTDSSFNGFQGRFRMGALGLALTDAQSIAFRSIIRTYLEALGNPT